MKIKKLNLISYGKFNNKEINFSDGLNIVYGKNGSGKSTVMAFIRAMLYGFSGRGAVSINDRKHYLPWGGQTLSGSMDIKTDEGKEIKLSRTSGKSQGFDKMSCFDISNSEEYDFSAENVISCGEDAFLKTLCIKQLQTAFSGEDSEISKKLINLTQSACEDIDTEKTIEIITNYTKLFKALRGDKGIISDTEKEIAALNERIYAAKEKRLSAFTIANKRKEILSKKEDLEKELAKTESEIENAKNAELFIALNSLLKEASENENKIKELYEKLQKNEKILQSLSAYSEDAPQEMFTPHLETASIKKEKNELISKIKISTLAAVTLAILTALFLISGFFVPPLFAPCLVAAVGTFISAANRTNLKDKLHKSEADLARAEEHNSNISALLSKYGVSDIREYAEKSAEFTRAKTENENISSTLSSLSLKKEELAAKIEECKKKTENLTYVEGLSDIDTLYNKRATLGGEISTLLAESSHIEGVLSADSDPDEAPEILQAKLSELIIKRDEALEEYEAATLALDTINAVFSEMRSDFTPLVNEKASSYLKELTGGDIDKIYIDKKFSVTAEKEGVKELSYFSLGTADQTYFAIRKAICDLLFGKDKPLFIDDAFLQYDVEREQKAFDLLKKFADEGQQIIFFTCKEYPEIEGANIINL